MGKQLDNSTVLYTKRKDVVIRLTPENRLCVTAAHVDFRHEMELEIVFSQPRLIIEDVLSEMKLYPHPKPPRTSSVLRFAASYWRPID